MKKLLTRLFALGLGLGLAACEEGSFEKAGRSIDKAAEDTKDKLKDATR